MIFKFEIFVVTGPDGTGKSTVLENFLYKKGDVVCHTFPSVVSATKNEDRDKGPPNTDPNATYGYIMSTAKLFYLIVKFWTKLIALIVLKRPKRIIFDRYLDEVMVDPRRFLIKAPRLFLILFAKFMPKPKCRVLLLCSPNVAAKRKQDLSINQIKDRYYKYFEFFGDQLILINNDDIENPLLVAKKIGAYFD